MKQNLLRTVLNSLLISILCIYLQSPGQLLASSGWTAQQSNTTQSLSGVSFVNENIGTVVGYNGTILHTTNGGINWSTSLSGESSSFNSVFFTSALYGYAAAANVVYRTTTGGSSWSKLSDPGTTDIQFVYALNHSTIFIGGTSGMLRVSRDSGHSWNALSSTSNTYLADIFFLNDSIGFFVGGSGSIRRTSNAGNDWYTMPSGTQNALRNITFIKTDSGSRVGYIVGDGVVLKSTDDGMSWSKLTAPSTTYLFKMSFLNVDTGFIVAYNGNIYRTTNGCRSWSGEKLSKDTLLSIYFVNDTVGFAVGLHGVIYRTTNTGTVWVNDNKELSLIGSVQNYPNPFTTTTKINIASETSRPRVLEVRNILGRLLYKKPLERDENEVVLDGSQFPEGVYIYSISDGKNMYSRTMIRVR